MGWLMWQAEICIVSQVTTCFVRHSCKLMLPKHAFVPGVEACKFLRWRQQGRTQRC